MSDVIREPGQRHAEEKLGAHEVAAFLRRHPKFLQAPRQLPVLVAQHFQLVAGQ